MSGVVNGARWGITVILFTILYMQNGAGTGIWALSRCMYVLSFPFFSYLLRLFYGYGPVALDGLGCDGWMDGPLCHCFLAVWLKELFFFFFFPLYFLTLCTLFIRGSLALIAD